MIKISFKIIRIDITNFEGKKKGHNQNEMNFDIS